MIHDRRRGQNRLLEGYDGVPPGSLIATVALALFNKEACKIATMFLIPVGTEFKCRAGVT